MSDVSPMIRLWLMLGRCLSALLTSISYILKKNCPLFLMNVWSIFALKHTFSSPVSGINVDVMNKRSVLNAWVCLSEYKAGELVLLTSDHTQACYLMELYTWNFRDKGTEGCSCVLLCTGERPRKKKRLSGFSILSWFWHLVAASGTANVF